MSVCSCRKSRPSHPVIEQPGAMTHLDPRSPLVIDTAEVGHRPGSMAELSRVIPAPADLGTDVISVPQGDPLTVDLRLESVVEGVLVTGTVRGRATGACVRCLDPVEEDVDVRFQELFAWPERAEHHREVGTADDAAADDHVIVDGLIDLETVVRDTVVPALPFQPRCAPDCPGLCSQCGVRLADDPAHEHDVIDPRWAALQTLASAAPTDTEEKRN